MFTQFHRHTDSQQAGGIHASLGDRHASSRLACGIHAILGDKPLIMGILNVTPDSFSDGGKYSGLNAALQQVELMLAEGVDIIDIGGESTRPGADPVAAKEQIQRVVPVIAAIRQQLASDILISIDTTLSEVAKAALDAGANIINDVSAGRDDAAILTLAAQTGVSIILMHSQGEPKTMQDNPHYNNVVQEVLDALNESINAALKAGIKKEAIAIDPGIGFGKRKQDNLDLLAHLDALVATGFPVLLGTSRKRFMGAICDVTEPSELVTATAVTTALGVMAGVQMFRVHDVKENRQAADVAWAIKRSR
jgi:dihydropteroate synthase